MQEVGKHDERLANYKLTSEANDACSGILFDL